MIVYLKDEPPETERDALLDRISSIGGVQRIRYISKADALASLKQTLGSQADITEQLPRNPLPASIEVTPDPVTATPEGTRELARALSELPEADDVQGGAQWVQGLAQFQRLFQLIGLGVGAVLALAAILTVTTATTLALHLRREEMEIMRLVGAGEAVIRLPRVLQGMGQGLVAAVLALAALELAYALAGPRLEPLLPLTLGLERTIFFSPVEMLCLMGAGAALGGAGGLLARGRGQR